MEKNAIHIETECYSLMSSVAGSQTDHQPCMDNDLCRRLKLLAIMIKSVAKGHRMIEFCKKTMLKNVAVIAKALDGIDQEKNRFLKVA